MPQKQVVKQKKIEKPKAANRNGKRALQRKGKFEKPPKGGVRLEQYKEAKELTKVINNRNESNIAGLAEQAGGKLKSIKGKAPPVNAPKDKKQRAVAAAKAAAAMEDD